MSFSTDGKKWTVLQDVDAKFLSTATAGGFVGSVFGLYVTSLGEPSSTKAHYDWFEYKGNDEVFRQ
jgi:alpha-N-arabinofuranosidase